LLHLLHHQLPTLFETVDGGDKDREWALAVLRRFVFADLNEVDDLRTTGQWKPSVSVHSGDKVYRAVDARRDVDRFLPSQPNPGLL